MIQHIQITNKRIITTTLVNKFPRTSIPKAVYFPKGIEGF